MALIGLAIRNFKPGAKPCKRIDGDGLYVEVHPNGSKYWCLENRFAARGA
ncbi:MAG TPA: DUF4102 domain-containing protein [Chromatiales bacterium]|nr:DUF4102 domain-containing protein [Chromatiales bacterium]